MSKATNLPTSKLPPMAAGQRYGRLTAIERVGTTPWRSAIWRFKCECGVEKTIPARDVRCGDTQSCGCKRKDAAVARNTIHGETYSPEYRVWFSMLQRCTNPNRNDYQRYGGRGISVCPQWLESFGAFLGDMGRMPGSGYSIDRIQNDLGYFPGNCRWASAKEQARNRRSTRIVVYNGTEMSLAEAVERSGLNYGAVLHRLKKGWPIDLALSAPIKAAATS